MKLFLAFMLTITARGGLATHEPYHAQDVNRAACTTGKTLHEDEGFIQSPSFHSLGGIATTCRWNIQTRKNSFVFIEFQSFNIHSDNVCSFGYVEVYDGNTTRTAKMMNKKLCGEIVQDHFLATGNSVVIIYYLSSLNFGQEFSITWTARGIQIINSEITNFMVNADLQLFIHQSSNHSIRLNCDTKLTEDRRIGPSFHLDSPYAVTPRITFCDTNNIINVLGGQPIIKTILGLNEEEYLDSEEGSWPWQVLLMLDYFTDQRYKQICQGSILSDTYVITAAHCVEKYESDDIVVYVGKHVSNKEESSEQKLLIKEILVHPKRISGAFDNDIALLKLATEITFTPYVRPACLLPDDVGDVTMCVVAGWTIAETFTYQHTYQLKEMNVDLLERRMCQIVTNLALNSTGGSEVICSERKDGTRRVTMFSEDTGGPLVCFIGSKWHITGITGKVLSIGSNSRMIIVHSWVDTEWIEKVTSVTAPPASRLPKPKKEIDSKPMTVL